MTMDWYETCMQDPNWIVHNTHEALCIIDRYQDLFCYILKSPLSTPFLNNILNLPKEKDNLKIIFLRYYTKENPAGDFIQRRKTPQNPRQKIIHKIKKDLQQKGYEI